MLYLVFNITIDCEYYSNENKQLMGIFSSMELADNFICNFPYKIHFQNMVVEPYPINESLIK